MKQINQMKLINVYNMYMEKKLTPTLLAKTKGLEKCIVRCVICSGTGLVKKKTTTKTCGCLSYTFCNLCQNSYKHGLYEECEVCYGLGVTTVKIDNKKINYNSIAN